MKEHYTDDDFKNAIKESTSIRQVLYKLGIKESGGNYFTAKLRIKKLCLDVSHFTGRGHLKGKTHNWTKQTPLEDILIENSLWGGGTSKLKKKIIKAGYLEYKCHNCGLTEWLGKPISIELEHKNGNNFDNRIENLTLLCPNCHSQTSTFRGRKLKGTIHKSKHKKTKKIYCCVECGVQIGNRSKHNRCVKCSQFMQRKAPRPCIEVLLKDVEELGYSGTGRKYGVSDNTIRKWVK
jgi:Zn finger protein HypA/HybF involved in hydrogenase expression